MCPVLFSPTLAGVPNIDRWTLIKNYADVTSGAGSYVLTESGKGLAWVTFAMPAVLGGSPLIKVFVNGTAAANLQFNYVPSAGQTVNAVSGIPFTTQLRIWAQSDGTNILRCQWTILKK